jgi:hypothetical protein
VSSADRGQVTHVLHVLGQIARLGDPIAVIRNLATAVEAIALPPPGDPGRCRGLAAAFRTAGSATTPIASDVRTLGSGTLPTAWRGSAGVNAARVVTATADVVGRVEPAFAVAARALDDYAATVEQLQKRHGELHQRLRELWHDASTIRIFGVTVDVLDVQNLSRIVAQAIAVLAGCIDVYEQSLSAADELEGHLADVAGRARATADTAAGDSAIDAVVNADTLIGAGDHDSAILPPALAARAADLRAKLSPQERAQLDALLAGASSPEERAYLLKTFAAGHSVADVAAFDAKIHGKDPAWLRSHLSLIDPGITGSVTFNGRSIEQYNETTCGSTSIVIAHAMTDPLYAFQLTTGGDPDAVDPTGAEFGKRLDAEEQRTHDSTNTVWPQAIGTSPWGMAGGMGDQLGGDYDWHLVDDTDARDVDPVLAGAVRAADSGQPVPVLIGDSVPRHYVLLVGHEGDDLLFYDPSGGEVTRVGEDDFRNGRMGALGFDHVQGVILPKK